MTDETDHIARAAACLDDPYAALNQHPHGDRDKCEAAGCHGKSVIRFGCVRLCRDCYAKLDLSA